jgi:transcriptional regulator
VPCIERKWEIIDEKLISKYEITRENQKIMLQLRSEGLRQTEIAKRLGVSSSCVSINLKKIGGSKNG